MKLIDGVFTAYVGKMLLVRFIVLLAIISMVWQTLDLLNNSDAIMLAEGASSASLLRYISLSLPQIISQFIPFAALLAIVFTLTGLSISSEITIMRAAGMSVNRVLFPIGIVCFLIAAGHFVFQEFVAVSAADRLEYWRANDYAHELPPAGTTRTDIRLTYEDNFIEAKSAERTDQKTVLNDVTIYERNDKLIEDIILAKEAVFEESTWRLENVTRMDAINQRVINNAREPWQVEFTPDFLFALSLNPDRTSLQELWQKIRQMRIENADTRSEMTSFLGRFSRPLGTLIMPLLGAIAGFGIHRQGVMLARAINGSILGFTYFIAENISLALGKLGVLPAIIGAFFPLTLFLVVGFTIIVAMESK